MLKKIITYPNDNYSSLAPYSFVACIHGLKNVGKKKGVYNLTRHRYVLSVINTVVFLVSVYYQDYTYREESAISNVYNFCFRMFYFGIAIRGLLIYISSLKNGRKEIGLFENVDGFDELLGSIDNSISIDFKTIYYKSMFIVMFAIITDATTEIFIYLMSYETVNIFVLISHLLPLFIGDLSKCYFYLWTCIIRARFSIINDRISVIGRNTISVFKFEKDFTFLMDMHKKLTELARDMNGLFQVEMMLHFLMNFLVAFANSYYCVFMMAKEKGDNTVFWFTTGKYFVFLWFEYFVLIRSCKELCQEAEKTRNILCNTKIDVNDDISHRLVIASIYELNENKLVVTVCRLFDIDYSTIFVMYATIANYVFIMLQFEEDKK